MAVLTVYQGAQCLQTEFEGQQPLYQLLEHAGISVARPCAGRGVCGKCAVILRGQVCAPNEAEQAAGTRLACQAQVFGDAQGPKCDQENEPCKQDHVQDICGKRQIGCKNYENDRHYLF